MYTQFFYILAFLNTPCSHLLDGQHEGIENWNNVNLFGGWWGVAAFCWYTTLAKRQSTRAKCLFVPYLVVTLQIKIQLLSSCWSTFPLKLVLGWWNFQISRILFFLYGSQKLADSLVTSRTWTTYASAQYIFHPRCTTAHCLKG